MTDDVIAAKLGAEQYLTGSLQTDSARGMEHNHCSILSLICSLPIIFAQIQIRRQTFKKYEATEFIVVTKLFIL